MAVDLVSPMPETAKKNRWILIPVDHFTKSHDALAIPDITVSVAASTFAEQVLCYKSLPEQIYYGQRA